MLEQVVEYMMICAYTLVQRTNLYQLHQKNMDQYPVGN